MADKSNPGALAEAWERFLLANPALQQPAEAKAAFHEGAAFVMREVSAAMDDGAAASRALLAEWAARKRTEFSCSGLLRKIGLRKRKP